MRNRAIKRSKQLATITIGSPQKAEGAHGDDGLRLLPIELPHDAHPTVAYRVEHNARVAVVLTDMGRPDRDIARRLAGAHVLVLEFNHDTGLLERGPYPPALRRRIAGNAGHLSNEQAAQMLGWLAGEELHTLVLAHLSEPNNRPLLAIEAARAMLDDLGLGHVRVLVASQHEVGPNLEV